MTNLLITAIGRATTARAGLQSIAVFASLSLPCSLARAAAGDWVQTSGPGTGIIRAVATDGSTALAAGVARLYRSADAGATWSPTAIQFPTTPLVDARLAFVGSVAFAANDGQPLQRSFDGALTWEALPSSPQVRYLSVDGGRLYAVTGSFGLAYSDDLGDTWTPITVPAQLVSVLSRDGTLFAGTFATLQMLRSVDGGANWTSLSLPFGSYAEVAATSGAVLTREVGFGAVFRSTNNGGAWTQLAQFTQHQNFALAATPTTALVAAHLDAGTSVYRSTDDGATWSPGGGLPAGAELFPQGLAVAGDLALLADYNGVYRSDDAGATWSASSTGLRAATVVDLASGADGALFATTSGSGVVWRTVDQGRTWDALRDGLPLDNPILSQNRGLLPVDADTVFVGTDRYGVYRSQDGGANWQAVNAGLPQYNGTAGNQFREMDHLAYAAGRAFVATGYGTEFINGQFQLTGAGVYRSDNLGQSWTASNTGLPRIFSTRIPPANAIFADEDVAFVSLFLEGIFRSTDGGLSWSAANTGLPRNGSGDPPEFSAFARIGASYFAAAEFFSFGAGGSGVFRSDDGGVSWASASGGLPAGVAVTDLSVRGSKLYAAADGVFVSHDLGQSWQPVGPALDGAPTNRLASGSGGLYAGVDFESVWLLRLPAAAPPLPPRTIDP